MKEITGNDPEARSANLIAKNVERLKSLFPEAFTEGKLISTCSSNCWAGTWKNGKRSTASTGTVNVKHDNWP